MSRRTPAEALVSIYGLADPTTGDVRYVGKAVDPLKRLKEHLRERRRASPLYSWIESLRRRSLAPALVVLETCPADEWPDRERFHIAALRASGGLLNLADGGDQPMCPLETRAANGRKNAAARDPRIWALKRSIGEGLKNGWVTEATKEKLRYVARKRPDLFGEWAAL